MRLWNWLRGLMVTVDIWLHDRELYRELCQPVDFPGDFEDVTGP